MAKKQIAIGSADLNPGERKIIEVDGKSIGLFNVNGEYFALHNRCPHMGGNLCAGPVTGTTLPTDKTEFIYGRVGELVRCGWHGWEFEIKSGQCTVDPKIRAKVYKVLVEDEQLVIQI
jgi:3-phenylpropionate/trans-cinnamate dioxygenase ferredoxin subunit